MSMVIPTLNLPQAASATAMAKPALPAAAPSVPSAAPASSAKPADAPSTTVTLSAQAQSALATGSHPSTSASFAATNMPVPTAHDGSMYESLKNGISSAVGEVGDVIAGAAHAVVDGVETTLSTANDIAKGALGLPFAAVAKVCDAAGAVIDEF